MKSIFKTIRSIITSFLCIILIIVVIIQFLLTVIRINNINIPNIIDKEEILEVFLDSNIKNDLDVHDAAIEYVDRYIKYVFYKRSYPSIKNNNETLNILKNKIDLDYKSILIIRKINNLIFNNSIYLLMNIAIVIILLIIGIVNCSFIKSFKYVGISMIFASIIIFGIFALLFSSYINITNSNYIIISTVKRIVGDNYLPLLGIYLLIGLGLTIIFHILEKKLWK